MAAHLALWVRRWWELRRSPSSRTRRLWYLAHGLLAALLLCPGPTAWVLLGLWIMANAGLALVALGWGLAHPRAVLRGGHAIVGWTFWLAALAAVLLTTTAQVQVPEQLGVELATLPTVMVGLAIAMAAAGVAALFSVAAAALGAFAARNGPAADAGAERGVHLFWVAVLAAALLIGVLPAAALPLGVAVAAAVPTATAWAVLRLPPPSAEAAASPLVRAVTLLERRLVLFVPLRGRIRALDTRGVSLGLLAGLAVLPLLRTPLLEPLRAEVLVTLIRLRNQPLMAAPSLAELLQSPATRDLRNRCVVVELDPAARRRALGPRSEVALQAAAIRTLHRWRAAQIVLLLPALQTAWVRPVPARLDSPLPTDDAVRRNLRDLPLLEAAMREAGNVVLAVPRLGLSLGEAPPPGAPGLDAATDHRVQRLLAAAAGAGLADPIAHATATLPCVPTTLHPTADLTDRWNLLHAALVVAAREQGEPPAGPGLAVPPGHRRRFAEIAPGRVLVELYSRQPEWEFPTISLTSLLSGEPVYLRTIPPAAPGPADRDLSAGREPGSGRSLDEAPPAAVDGVPPAGYFRGRLVFLPSLVETELPTPVGPASRTRVLAAATATLLDDRQARPSPAWALIALTVLAAAAQGMACAGRDPLSAGLRALLGVMAVHVLAAFLFLLQGYFLDPVTPGVAMAGAAALVTQFTFVVQKKERDDTRHWLERLVAPAVAAELLSGTGRVEEFLGLRGRRRPLCVLFADARDFSHFTETHAPEEVVETINAYMGAMTDCVFAHGGILDKYTGDGLMALFLVGDDVSADVDRALRAALAAREAAEVVSAQLREGGREPLRIGQGLHLGEAVVGLVGSPRRVDYTALGNAVVVSHRLQALAEGGEVLVSEAVRAHCGARLSVVPRPPVYVKGLATPVTPYLVLGMEEAVHPRDGARRPALSGAVPGGAPPPPGG